MLTASVFVNIPVKSIAKEYTYRIPEELSYLDVGWRVFVPFGGRRVEGFVLATEKVEDSEIALKDILEAVDEEAWFTPKMIEAARWMSEFYLCSLAETMRLFMPGKSGLRIFARYSAAEEHGNHILLQTELYQSLYRCLLRDGPLTRREIKKRMGNAKFPVEEILEKLLRYHLVEKEYVAESRVKEKLARYVSCKVEVTAELLESLKRRKAQCRLLNLLKEHDEQLFSEIEKQGISSATIKAAEESGLVEIKRRRVLRDSYREVPAQSKDFVLTDDQQKALSEIVLALAKKEYQGFLLHGVTGSGKTQVYIEAAEQARAAGRKVIVLVPEIALTGQLVRAFRGYFDDVIVMHSQLSVAERNDAIFRMRRGEASIIIGARSALFTPADNVGLIIMDEEQDMSYKQDESPRYHARVVAEQLAQIHHAVLILGSATPSVESFARARLGKLRLLTMPKRIGNKPLPFVKCVDMRQELRMGNRHVISWELQDLLEETMCNQQQMIVMLNRRGFSTFVMCRSCGEALKCRFCGLPLVYHANGALSCHHCDVQEKVPAECPKCGSRYIKFFGSGTEKLERELREILPNARVIRMDRDTTGKKFAHQNILDEFRKGAYDILLGTQMVAKGHDIPNVTAVGIVSADSSLNLPDFRASERCFMLITQTAGRAGRGKLSGKVVVQSYNPEHYAVACGIKQDYQGFYEKEIAMRRQLLYPPFRRLIKILFQDKLEERARENAKLLIEAFRKEFPKQEENQAIGPSPAMISQFRGIYRFIVLIKASNLLPVQEFLRRQGLHRRTDVAIDIDPISMM